MLTGDGLLEVDHSTLLKALPPKLSVNRTSHLDPHPHKMDRNKFPLRLRADCSNH